jgi:hypothetical protein
MALPELSERVPWPWSFSRADLMAGLRRHMADPGLRILDVRPNTLPRRRPSVGRIQGVSVEYEGEQGRGSVDLVVKEPQGTTRTGLAGAGRREVGVYRSLAGQLPLRTPKLIAASPGGDWLLLEDVSSARDASRWRPQDYLAAVDSLAHLHDRFWGLGEDLDAFPWLARPLEADFDVHLAAAGQAMGLLEKGEAAAGAEPAPGRVAVLRRLTAQAARVAGPLRREPSTLLHGDYWPGNLSLLEDDTLAVYDWQSAGVGPGVVDLLVFVTKSEWWFGSEAVDRAGLIRAYREGLAERVGVRWPEDDWDLIWDHALLWRFLQEWLDLLAASPPSLLRVQSKQMDDIWLRPVTEAIDRRLGGGG